MARVVVTGSFNVDHVWIGPRLPLPGETLAGRYVTGPGGKGFNQATAARRSGANTCFVCALGADDGGRLARRLADADGIDLRAQDSTEATGTAGIYLDAEGRNSIVIGPGANASLDSGFITAQADAFAGAGVVLTQLESPPEAILAALRLARATGAVAMLNPAPANAPTDSALLEACDLMTPNETEFNALLARHAGTQVPADAIAGMADTELHALCRHLLPHGSVVVTLGAQGCFASHPETAKRGDPQACYRVPAAPANAIDTTGAGDAFNGALAASLAAAPERPFATHLHYAACYAALATEHEGAAAAMPLHEAVVRRFPGST